MEQTYQNRGKLAFVQDQADAAVTAFQAGELVAVDTILNSIRAFLEEWGRSGWK